MVDLEISEGECSSGGAGDEDLETTLGTETPGGGAPLTIWSSFELDMPSAAILPQRPGCVQKRRSKQSHAHLVLICSPRCLGCSGPELTSGRVPGARPESTIIIRQPEVMHEWLIIALL